jgi:hypothetical protein
MMVEAIRWEKKISFIQLIQQFAGGRVIGRVETLECFLVTDEFPTWLLPDSLISTRYFG